MTVREQQLYYFLVMCFARIHNLFHKRPLKPKSILIIKLDEIGDVVNSLHIPELLKKEYPDCAITLWVKPFIKPLLTGTTSINTIITSENDLDKSYDIVIDLRGNWESFSTLRKIKYQWLIERGSIRFRNKFNGGQKHEVYTNLEVVGSLLKTVPKKPILSISLEKESIEKANDFLSKHGIQQYALLHTSARRALRRWNPERFAAIALYLKKEFDFDIIFTGDQSDEAVIAEIQSLLNFQTYSTSNELDLAGFAALCKKTKIFIGNESGPMHIAAISGCPTIGLFGPGVPTTFYPYGEQATYIHYVLQCNPCDQIHCVRPESPCISLITVEELIQKINLLLAPKQ